MSAKKPYFNTCPNCGANLDPGERCDCETRRFVESEAAKRGMHLEQFEGNPTRYFLVNAEGKKVSGVPYKMSVWKDELSPIVITEYDRETWIEGINIMMEKLNTWQLEYINSVIQDVYCRDRYNKPRADVPHLFSDELKPERIYKKIDRREMCEL